MAPPFATLADAAARIRTRDTIGFGLGPANPDAFFTALGARDDWEDLTFGGALLLGYYTVLTHPKVSYRCGFFGPAERTMLAQGANIDLVPGGFRQFAPILRRFAPRVMTAQAAPPDADGMVNLSLHLGATYDELVMAGSDPDRLLVIEVNPNLPRTCSLPPDYSNVIPLDLADVVVESGGAPFALPQAAPDDIDQAIAERARSFIVDGATLQIGIGAVPDMVASQLASGAGGSYGIHTEMFTDGLMQLHLAGKVTNDAKSVFNGVSIATFALGSTDLYRWLDGNRDVALVPVQVVNDPTVIARNHSFVSINGALSVDLYGQVVADHIDGKQISGVGGHEDFVAGAELRIEDHSLICLRSTAVTNGVTRSRIVPLLPEGSVVSTPRHHTGVVITEYGAADLSGRTVRERAAALAAIAHPDFRDELADRAAALGRP
ncbi:MAG TPA: acetyl-CoA hydrolase/transferase C-terminal domain-containing protein [Acidimicrobiales bacterium]|jgi:acyl-CoA hydrolase|nr:acetyl-CoA hydrolase/transferase C-terminal domain-containing protein [Acidimicrobiales bacterium]